MVAGKKLKVRITSTLLARVLGKLRQLFRVTPAKRISHFSASTRGMHLMQYSKI
jgi:hypothetical protein